ncbi:MAG TPA: chaperone modulator CbpM [Syntrophobacteraceae bacterium]|nr:chaperone modulator CbpM [Syntrophobacteraceae bacterium]
MAEGKYFLVRKRRTSLFSPYLTLYEVACHCGLHPDFVERLVSMGLIDYVERDSNGDVLFPVDVVPVVRRILRLRNHLGVNYAGIGVILELMARIEFLENQVRELEKRVHRDG